MNKSSDRLSLLETFARIAERGSITAAARDLGMSQAAASRQLKQLETRLSTQLILRTTHSLALTEAGRELLTEAKQVLLSWDALEERHVAAKDAIEGPLKVVAPVALGHLHLTEFATEFLRRNPGVRMTWQLEDQPISFTEIGCDCWIKVGAVPDETLVVRPLAAAERLLVAAPEFAATQMTAAPEDLETVPFCALDPFEGRQLDLHNEAGAVRTVRPQTILATNNIFTLRTAAVDGIGAAVLPRWFIERDLSEGRLVDALPGWRAAQLDINLAYLPAKRRPKRLEQFITAVTERIREIPGLVTRG